MKESKKERNLKQIDGKWYLDFTFKGKRIRQFGGYTKAQAQTVLAKLRIGKLDEELGLKKPAQADVLFEDFAEGLISKQGFKRPNTLRSRRTCLNALLKSDLFKDKKLGDITPETVAKYHAGRAEKCMVSANRELGFLKLIYKRAQEWGKVDQNPAARIKKLPETKNKLRILTDDEADRLLTAASSSLAPFLTILLTTAMRPHEAFALRWAHDGWEIERDLRTSIVSLEKRVIFIPGALAKNHKDREVPLSRELLTLLEALPRDPGSAKVFPWTSIPKSFRAAVKGAKLKGVDLYTLKHTAASRMIRAGVDLVTVTELIGHADVKTTMIYCHSSAETKREAVEKLSGIYAARKAQADAAPAPAEAAQTPAQLTN
jgi:integrase